MAAKPLGPVAAASSVEGRAVSEKGESGTGGSDTTLDTSITAFFGLFKVLANLSAQSRAHHSDLCDGKPPNH